MMWMGGWVEINDLTFVIMSRVEPFVEMYEALARYQTFDVDDEQVKPSPVDRRKCLGNEPWTRHVSKVVDS
jgi:hypothetical protein